MFFIVEKRGYIISQVILIAAALIFSMSPDDWYTSGFTAHVARSIRDNWPKMESDATFIGMVDSVRAVKYVLVSGFSLIVSLMTTLLLLILMMRMRLDGPPPYYVNRNNLTLIPFVLIFVVYGFLFDRVIAGMSAETSHFARAIFHTDWCLGLSACGIGLVGTGVVRLFTIYLRRFRDGSEFPANS